jgi:hypothetical protein
MSPPRRRRVGAAVIAIVSPSAVLGSGLEVEEAGGGVALMRLSTINRCCRFGGNRAVVGNEFQDRDSGNRDKIEGNRVAVVSQMNRVGNFFRVRSIIVSGGT